MNLKHNVRNSLPSMLLIATVFVISTITSLIMKVPMSEIMGNFNYSVIVILIAMELHGVLGN